MPGPEPTAAHHFHAVYLAFLVQRAGSGLAELIGLSFWVCVVSFALNHYWSYRCLARQSVDIFPWHGPWQTTCRTRWIATAT